MVRLICVLLLALLLLAAAAARFRLVIKDKTLQSRTLSKKVIDICMCRHLCLEDRYCTAVSYNYGPSICNMTYEAPQNVTLRSQSGVITLLKFHRSSCQPIVPHATIFITTTKTNTGIWQEQRSVCDVEDGVPLIINTQRERAAAAQAVAGVTESPFDEKYAWITATWTVSQTEGGCLQWPDGFNVTDCAYTTKDLINFQNKHVASMVRDDDKVESSSFSTQNNYSVLCKKRSGF